MIGEEIQMISLLLSSSITKVLPEQGFALIHEEKITPIMMKECNCLKSKKDLNSFMT